MEGHTLLHQTSGDQGTLLGSLVPSILEVSVKWLAPTQQYC